MLIIYMLGNLEIKLHDTHRWKCRFSRHTYPDCDYDYIPKSIRPLCNAQSEIGPGVKRLVNTHSTLLFYY